MPTEYLPPGKKRKVTEPSQYKWWAAKEDEISQGVFSVVNQIETTTSYRTLQNLKFARLYHNLELQGFEATLYNQLSSPSFSGNRVTLNVVKSCVDTVSAKIAQNTPRIEFITSDGNFLQQRRAKQLSKYVAGCFKKMNVYELAQRIFVDSCVYGTGALHLYQENGEIKAERVLIHELVIDDAEAVYGEPQQLHRRKYTSRDKLLDAFPDCRQQIIDATTDERGNEIADQVKVIESWHLKSGPNATDGYRSICINDCTILAEPYDKPYFPFCFLRWSNRLIGFFGMGLAEELVGIQFEINKILRNIQASQNLMAIPRVAVEASSMVNASHLSTFGAVIKYVGTKPEALVWPSMTPEIYQHFITLYNKAYEITGVSQASAASQREKGLDSAAAQREVSDQKSERFILAAQRYERFYVDVAEMVVDMSRDLYSEGENGNGQVMAVGTNQRRGNKFVELIDWKDAEMANDEFTIEAFAVHMLPSTPAGRLQKVTEMIQAGWVTKAYGMSLLNFPDTEQFESLQDAALDDVRMTVDNILYDGDYNPPDKYMNLQLALEISHSTYLRARTQKGIKKKNLELLGNFIDEVTDLMQAAAPPAPAPEQQAPMAQPQGQPTSDLLPVGQ